MLTSVLLHLSGIRQGSSVINLGVRLAQQNEARLRGLSLLDTRHLVSLTTTCDAAVHTSGEYRRLQSIENQQRAVRGELTQACLSAGIDFDIRRMRGNPFELLPTEARVHDLVISSCALPGSKAKPLIDSELTPGEMVDLLLRGVQPLLVLRDAQQLLDRILLVYDGTTASGQAIRSFLNQNLFPAAAYRLLAIGSNEEQALAALHEMQEVCRVKRPGLEFGSLAGTMRSVMLPYAEKWQANLIVFGVARENAKWRRLFGEPVQDILRKTHCAIYATA